MYALAVYVYVCVYVYGLLLIQMYLDISATYLRNYMSASLAGYVCVCIYVCVLLLIQMYLDISATYLRNLDENVKWFPILFEEHSTKLTKITPKCPKQREAQLIC